MEQWVARLAHLRRQGVDVVDLSVAAAPTSWLRLLSRAQSGGAPPPGRGVPVALVPVRGAFETNGTVSEPFTAGRAGVDLVAMTGKATSPRDLPPEDWSIAQELVRRGSVVAWGASWDDPARAAAEIPAALARGASILRYPAHLLAPDALFQHGAKIRSAGAVTVVADPFADGRLDGSWLVPGASGPSIGPPQISNLADLHARWDPVKRLGFLTEGGRRTLPQAAVAALLGEPSVGVVLVPIDPPELFQSVQHLDPTTRLTPSERAAWSRAAEWRAETADDRNRGEPVLAEDARGG